MYESTGVGVSCARQGIVILLLPLEMSSQSTKNRQDRGNKQIGGAPKCMISRTKLHCANICLTFSAWRNVKHDYVQRDANAGTLPGISHRAGAGSLTLCGNAKVWPSNLFNSNRQPPPNRDQHAAPRMRFSATWCCHFAGCSIRSATQSRFLRMTAEYCRQPMTASVTDI